MNSEAVVIISRKTRRSAAVLVETALVMAPLMLFMFSIFEYGRFLMVRQLLNHSAREGCRYAAVNNTSTTLLTDVTTLVTGQMAGSATKDLVGFTVAISAVNTAGTDTATWTSSSNQQAAIAAILPGDSIAVKLNATYKTIFPTLYFLPVSLPVASKVIMTCEGN